MMHKFRRLHRSRRDPASLACALVVGGVLPGGMFVETATAEPPPSDLTDAQLVSEAAIFHQRQDWVASADAYGELLARDDSVAQWWFRHGFAYHSLERFDESIVSFARCAELGDATGTAQYNAACGCARLGRHDEALDWLERCVDAGFLRLDLFGSDPDLASVRDQPRFMAITGYAAPAGLSRSERWRFDFDLLERRIEQMHPFPYSRRSRSEIAAAFEEVRERIPGWSDDRLACEVARLLASLDDGVSRPMVPGLPVADDGGHRYPVETWSLTDGVIVSGADSDHRELTGLEVVAIDGVPIEEVIERLAPYVTAANETGRRERVCREAIACAEGLHALGVARSATETTWRLRDEAGAEREVTLTAVPWAESRSDWSFLSEASDDSTRPYVIDAPPGERLVRLRWNSLSDSSGALNRMMRRVREAIERHDAQYLVVDVRTNGRAPFGRFRRLTELIGGLPTVTRRGHLFVIVGRSTGDDALDLVVDLERRTEAIFVGEETGGAPGLTGARRLVRLPANGLEIALAGGNRRDDGSGRASAARDAILPDIIAEPRLADMRAGRDVAMDAIRAFIVR